MSTSWTAPIYCNYFMIASPVRGDAQVFDRVVGQAETVLEFKIAQTPRRARVRSFTDDGKVVGMNASSEQAQAHPAIFKSTSKSWQSSLDQLIFRRFHDAGEKSNKVKTELWVLSSSASLRLSASSLCLR